MVSMTEIFVMNNVLLNATLLNSDNTLDDITQFSLCSME